ncbi:STAS domain-containing protein [Candidatus Aquicultor secundus]|nr:STAS domain-containing protein [Candidatus Aquicultor secundus]NCO65926.1 STAS domain-containing protein [Solirubrobacter sp.]
MSQFSFTIEVEDDHKLVVKPIGSLDFHTVGILKQALYPLAVNEDIMDITFDYSDVDYSDSSAFGLLLKLSRTVDGEVRVVNARPSLKRLFQMAGFDTLFFKDAGGGLGPHDHDHIA